MEKLQIDMNRLGEWAVENDMIINPAKSKAVCFTRARVTELLNYSLRDIVIPKASSCKYLGIILCSDLSWADPLLFGSHLDGLESDFIEILLLLYMLYMAWII
jgi:hypothetical protein